MCAKALLRLGLMGKFGAYSFAIYRVMPLLNFNKSVYVNSAKAIEMIIW
jgi:hypothetical protein